eukprot:s523_g10.t1
MAEYRISRGRLKFGAIGTVCQVCSMQAGEIQAAFLVMHCRRRGLAVVVMTSGLGSKIQSVLENSGQPVLYVLFVADGVAEIVGQFVFQLCSLAESVRLDLAHVAEHRRQPCRHAIETAPLVLKRKSFVEMHLQKQVLQSTGSTLDDVANRIEPRRPAQLCQILHSDTDLSGRPFFLIQYHVVSRLSGRSLWALHCVRVFQASSKDGGCWNATLNADQSEVSRVFQTETTGLSEMDGRPAEPFQLSSSADLSIEMFDQSEVLQGRRH